MEPTAQALLVILGAIPLAGFAFVRWYNRPYEIVKPATRTQRRNNSR